MCQNIYCIKILYECSQSISSGSLCLYVCLCSVTSSEKADKAQRYADFTLLSVPYPGKLLLLTFSLHQSQTAQADIVYRQTLAYCRYIQQVLRVSRQISNKSPLEMFSGILNISDHRLSFGDKELDFKHIDIQDFIFRVVCLQLDRSINCLLLGFLNHIQ